MKKSIIILLTLVATSMNAQENKIVPQISVSGEGKVKVAPDQVVINLGVQNTGKDAAEVKKMNDETVDKVVKYIKKFGIPTSDFQTTNVSLYKSYDYEKKKHNFQASQSITITLKDIKKYDELMMGLVDTGINNINGVEFKSSKLEEHKVTARKQAVLDAKKKAEDFASALNQKVGKAILITDNSQPMYQPQMYRNVMMKAEAMDSSQETLAIGEIEILTNINVTFMLE
ncbi:SIMPL domain-containing protein [Flavobacterium azooxidireducens]|uniref:SIMPL domain-containing protein n=1 Tax=Flavobacterium azooxidireducens TaxID=1871076 RepID=A0ABY4KGD7_9FLAO|nr:SIMPL domain-containing protein [Flavobacterium azooxidireducens]UPQ78853.1 SIMPL domain-containing protein [Flavobacterium azooxidireducens]